MKWQSNRVGVQVPVRVTKLETFYVEPERQWTCRWQIIVTGFLLVYVTYIGVSIYQHWSNPDWCSPWLQSNVCASAVAQQSVSTGLPSRPVASDPKVSTGGLNPNQTSP